MTSHHKIYRFKFSDATSKEIEYFSSKHQGDEATVFRENWNQWVENNNDIIERETRTLENMGFTGDCVKKMWTSARYYHKNKHTKRKIVVDKKERQYIFIDPSLIETIDNFIRKHLSEADFKPSHYFKIFLDGYDSQIKLAITDLETQQVAKDCAMQKIKKTFNNRYFILK
jgi:hypothetical protein